MNLQLGQKVSHAGQAWYVTRVGVTIVCIVRGVLDPVHKIVEKDEVQPMEQVWDDFDRQDAEIAYHAYNFSAEGCL